MYQSFSLLFVSLVLKIYISLNKITLSSKFLRTMYFYFTHTGLTNLVKDWFKSISCFNKLHEKAIKNTTAAAKSLQSCPTLCDPRDGSPPSSPVPRILQARTLGWVAISFSKAWKWNVKVKSLSPVWLFATPWTAAHQASPSMGFSRLKYWSGVPLPSAKKKQNTQLVAAKQYATK